jgi:septal ring factor EnvC (AmiA/AmiB activator)
MDHNELRQKLQQNKDELLEIESKLKDVRNRLEDVQNLRKRQKEIADFLNNNKQQLKQLRRDIAKLNLEDRKTLVEGMLQGNIVVDYQADNTLDRPGGIDADYRLRLNPEILQRFVDEGKIHFNKNS